MKEIRHLKTMKNKRNLNTKWLLLQNDQNADTTLLHSHDDMFCLTYEKLHILNKKKKSDAHFVMRHVPLKQPVIMVILFCLLRMTTCIVYYFEVSDLCRKGGIRIQNNFSTKFTLYTLTISH